METITVIGAGLAGSECAYQLASRGIHVRLIEQKPLRRTAAQHHDNFAELVCSNSFRGEGLHGAVGLLKEEMRRLGSLVIQVGDQTRVPAGGAMAVDRDRFSAEVTRRLRSHPNITIESREVCELPESGIVVVATGPLTGDSLARDISRRVGATSLAYYDAIAPVVETDSINFEVVFRASRYGRGGDDAYINCPMDQSTYETFVHAILQADCVERRAFEEVRHFEGCLPIEIMAQRGIKTLAFGPLKPVGLTDPRTGKRPYAVLQLRPEDVACTAYNLVGCQTRMSWGAQKEVFRKVPGLEQAEFVRFGTVHRNTFVDGPKVFAPDGSLRNDPRVFLAGQISGVEGYVESAAHGLITGLRLAARCCGLGWVEPPETTAIGGLARYVMTPRDDYQPSNVVWSMLPPLPGEERRVARRVRRERLSERGLSDLRAWVETFMQGFCETKESSVSSRGDGASSDLQIGIGSG